MRSINKQLIFILVPIACGVLFVFFPTDECIGGFHYGFPFTFLVPGCEAGIFSISLPFFPSRHPSGHFLNLDWFIADLLIYWAILFAAWTLFIKLRK
jgi:hypothetical protein